MSASGGVSPIELRVHTSVRNGATTKCRGSLHGTWCFSRLYTSVWLWNFSSPSHFYLHPWNIKNILTRAASSINQNGACVFRKGVVRGGNHLAAGSSVRNSRCRSQKTTTKRLAWDLSTTMFGILLAVPSPMCQNNPGNHMGHTRFVSGISSTSHWMLNVLHFEF